MPGAVAACLRAAFGRSGFVLMISALLVAACAPPDAIVGTQSPATATGLPGTVLTGSHEDGATPSLPPASVPIPSDSGETGTPPAEGTLSVRTNVPYATADKCGRREAVCQQFVDIYSPSGISGAPVVVMFHGRPRTPEDMAALATATAERGAVVFNADYRGVRPSRQKGFPDAVNDAACAIRYARAHAAEYGGDPSWLVVVGHSYGGYVGAETSLAGDEFDGECLVPDEAGSTWVDAYVGIDANCCIDHPTSHIWTTFFGGDRDDAAKNWRTGDPMYWLEHPSSSANRDLLVRMFHLRDDPVIGIDQPQDFVKALKTEGFDAKLVAMDGDHHLAPLKPSKPSFRAALDVIQEMLDARGS